MHSTSLFVHVFVPPRDSRIAACCVLCPRARGVVASCTARRNAQADGSRATQVVQSTAAWKHHRSPQRRAQVQPRAHILGRTPEHERQVSARSAMVVCSSFTRWPAGRACGRRPRAIAAFSAKQPSELPRYRCWFCYNLPRASFHPYLGGLSRLTYVHDARGVRGHGRHRAIALIRMERSDADSDTRTHGSRPTRHARLERGHPGAEAADAARLRLRSPPLMLRMTLRRPHT